MNVKNTIVGVFILPFLTAVLVLTGCAKQDFYRTDGLTLGAGDAIARNTALQVIDPWPKGVEDTKLLVPAELGRPADPAASTSAPAVKP